jgi:hypothetical protein
MAFGGVFIVQLDMLKNPPSDVDVLAIPFKNCPDGVLIKGTIVNVPLTFIREESTVLEFELEVFGSPIYYRGWEFICKLTNTDDLERVYEHLRKDPKYYGGVINRRFIIQDDHAIHLGFRDPFV